MSKLPARAGREWLRGGFALIRKQPGLLTTVLMVNLFIPLLLGSVPLVGALLASIIVPSMTMALMQACALIEQGQRATPSVLLAGFHKPQVVRLCQLGLIYVVIPLLFQLALSLTVSEGFVEQLRKPIDPENLPPSFESDMFAMLLIYLTMMASVLFLCFAAPLAHWQKMSPFKAIFYSFFAVLGAWRAFLALLLSVFGLFIMAATVVALLAQGSSIGSVLLLWLTMMFALLVQCAIYTAYRQIFGYAELGKPLPEAGKD